MYNKEKYSKGENLMKKIICSIILVSMCVIFSGCSNDSTIATVNGEDIKASLYNFYLTNIKQQLRTPANIEDATDYWNNTLIDGKHVADYAKDKALDEATKLVLIAQKAKQQGITLTTDDKSKIQQTISSTKKQAGGTEDSYKKYLAGFGLTDATFGQMLELTAYQQKLMEQMQSGYSADQIKNFYDNNMVNVKHILIMTVDPQSNLPLEGQALELKKQKAEDVMQKIKNGENFEKLLSENNEDTGAPPAGYTISKYSEMVEPFLTTSLALQVNQVSDLVQSTYGYHIIKRYEHKGNNDIFTAAQTDIKTGLFGQDVDNWKNESDIKINQAQIDKIKLQQS